MTFEHEPRVILNAKSLLGWCFIYFVISFEV